MHKKPPWRTRYLLPLEMLLYLQLLQVGVSGWIGRGLLWETLQARGESLVWGAMYVPIPAVAFILCVLEWSCGKGWTRLLQRRVIVLRQYLALYSFVCWLLILYLLTHGTSTAWRAMSIVLEAPTMAAFSVWAWWVNARTSAILNPKKNTKRLEERLSYDDRW